MRSVGSPWVVGRGQQAIYNIIAALRSLTTKHAKLDRISAKKISYKKVLLTSSGKAVVVPGLSSNR